MAEHQVYEVAGAADVERGTLRARPVRYTLTRPGVLVGQATGLVLLIPGFGEDNDAGYLQSLAGWIADTFGLACVEVDYHARGCRVSSGASRQFKQADADLLVELCRTHGVPVDEGVSGGELTQRLHKAYGAHVAAGRSSGVLTLTCGLVTRGGDLQNFGLMQALDHLHVLADLRHRLDYDRRNVLAMGSSHGGYLAQLISKLAPNTLRAVFDNAGYATAPTRYIDGRHLGQPDYIERYSDVMQMYFFVDSMWSLNEQASHFYHADARAMRSLMEPEHVEAMADAGGRRTRYRCIHGPDDLIAPTREKAACCARLAEAGFDVQYQCMGPGDVDGRYVKSLEHGLGLSLRGFFEKSYASLPAADLDGSTDPQTVDDFDRCTQLAYTGPTRTYQLDFGSYGVSIALA
ncbi:MAG: DUF2920 family protein [Phycisphaeraceae bacterium]